MPWFDVPDQPQLLLFCGSFGFISSLGFGRGFRFFDRSSSLGGFCILHWSSLGFCGLRRFCHGSCFCFFCRSFWSSRNEWSGTPLEPAATAKGGLGGGTYGFNGADGTVFLGVNPTPGTVLLVR